MTEMIAASLIASGGITGIAVVVCVTFLRALDMKIAEQRRKDEREEDDRIETILARLSSQEDAINDVRSSMSVRGMLK